MSDNGSKRRFSFGENCGAERVGEPRRAARDDIDCNYSIDLIPHSSHLSSSHLSLSSAIMSSSSSQAASVSRSPSPTTPSTPDSSDNVQVAPFRNTIDLSTWYKTLPAEPISPSTVYWDESSPRFSNMAKEDGANMLSLDDLIQDYAYDEYVPPSNLSSYTHVVSISTL